MFSTLNNSDLSLVQSVHVSTGRSQKSKFKRILGATARSKNGCLACRKQRYVEEHTCSSKECSTNKKRRKCDEAQPICGRCSRKPGLHCVWPHESSSELARKTREHVVEHQEVIIFDSAVDEYDDDIGTIEPAHIFLAPTSLNVMFNLLEELAYYVRSYQVHYCQVVAISDTRHNYYKETFLSLARTSEAILFAITAVGCLILDKDCNRKKSVEFLRKAFGCVKTSMAKHPNVHSLYELLCFYTICMMWLIFAGDTEVWYKFFLQEKGIIDILGGPRMVTKLFENSNDIKWIISYFQFHDLFASTSILRGTNYTIEDCGVLGHEHLSYGIDPLQGCLRPIHLLFGKINNACVGLRKMELKIRRDTGDVTSLRIEYYAKYREHCRALQQEIEASRPSAAHHAIKESSPEEWSYHMILFELYRRICTMYMFTHLKKMPPVSVEQQELLLECLRMIDDLIQTRLMVSLCMLLLICGINCYVESDRNDMRGRFEQIQENYKFGNFTKMVQIVEESWRRNPEGKNVVDWAGLANEYGWCLYLG